MLNNSDYKRYIEDAFVPTVGVWYTDGLSTCFGENGEILDFLFSSFQCNDKIETKFRYINLKNPHKNSILPQITQIYEKSDNWFKNSRYVTSFEYKEDEKLNANEFNKFTTQNLLEPPLWYFQILNMLNLFLPEDDIRTLPSMLFVISDNTKCVDKNEIINSFIKSCSLSPEFREELSPILHDIFELVENIIVINLENKFVFNVRYSKAFPYDYDFKNALSDCLELSLIKLLEHIKRSMIPYFRKCIHNDRPVSQILVRKNDNESMINLIYSELNAIIRNFEGIYLFNAFTHFSEKEKVLVSKNQVLISMLDRNFPIKTVYQNIFKYISRNPKVEEAYQLLLCFLLFSYKKTDDLYRTKKCIWGLLSHSYWKNNIIFVQSASIRAMCCELLSGIFLSFDVPKYRKASFYLWHSIKLYRMAQLHGHALRCSCLMQNLICRSIFPAKLFGRLKEQYFISGENNEQCLATSSGKDLKWPHLVYKSLCYIGKNLKASNDYSILHLIYFNMFSMDLRKTNIITNLYDVLNKIDYSQQTKKIELPFVTIIPNHIFIHEYGSPEYFGFPSHAFRPLVDCFNRRNKNHKSLSEFWNRKGNEKANKVHHICRNEYQYLKFQIKAVKTDIPYNLTKISIDTLPDNNGSLDYFFIEDNHHSSRETSTITINPPKQSQFGEINNIISLKYSIKFDENFDYIKIASFNYTICDQINMNVSLEKYSPIFNVYDAPSLVVTISNVSGSVMHGYNREIQYLKASIKNVGTAKIEKVFCLHDHNDHIVFLDSSASGNLMHRKKFNEISYYDLFYSIEPDEEIYIDGVCLCDDNVDQIHLMWYYTPGYQNDFRKYSQIIKFVILKENKMLPNIKMIYDTTGKMGNHVRIGKSDIYDPIFAIVGDTKYTKRCDDQANCTCIYDDNQLEIIEIDSWMIDFIENYKANGAVFCKPVNNFNQGKIPKSLDKYNRLFIIPRSEKVYYGLQCFIDVQKNEMKEKVYDIEIKIKNATSECMENIVVKKHRNTGTLGFWIGKSSIIIKFLQPDEEYTSKFCFKRITKAQESYRLFEVELQGKHVNVPLTNLLD